MVKGPWVAGSYYNAPGSEEQFDQDGYWKSGDIGTIDKEGYLKIADRKKDVIKSGGEWISSVDVENAIVGHPGVTEAAVIGVKHIKWEERPIAILSVKESYKDIINTEEIKKYLSKFIAKWQLPDKVIIVDEILKTSVGKYDKKLLREQYRDILL